MKNTIIKFSLALMAFSLTLSCDRTMEEINTDTSKIKKPTAGSFLAPLQYGMANYGYNRADGFTFQIMQVAIPFPNEGNTPSRYYLPESAGGGIWNTSYNWLKQAREMEQFAHTENEANYEAIAKVLKVWIYSNLTDTFGDVPYSEALNLEEGIMNPKFDAQKDIYVSLLDELEEANSLFDTTKAIGELDLFYHADQSAQGVVKWKKFGNSLALRLLNRIEKRNGEVNVHERIRKIVNNPGTYPIFESDGDTAAMELSGVSPFMPPIARPQDFTSYRAAGEFFVQTLLDNNDPRVADFFTVARDLKTNASIGYKGAPSAYAPGTVFDYQPSNVNQNLAKAPLKVFVYPYAELQFTLSELALKGIISGNAKTYYENGVKAALTQWGKTVPQDYFSNPVVAYKGTLEQIMTQKYIALFFVDQQQWFEHRRTGFPKLPDNGGLLNGGKMPQRLMYPTNPKIMNPKGYQAAVTQMGGDDINTLMWWNKP